jgi:hypothetical protein
MHARENRSARTGPPPVATISRPGSGRLPRALALLRIPLAASILFLGCGAALAQWAWRDENGHAVFSDIPPPPGTSPEQILQRPTAPSAAQARAASAPVALESELATPGSGPAAAAPVASGTAASASAPAPAAHKSWSELDAEFHKRQEERAKAEQKSMQEQASLRAKAEQCERARGALVSLEQGTRVLRPDASGERSFLEPEQRQAEITRMKEEVARNC